MNSNRALAVLAGVAIIFLLYWGEPFFVPLALALLISSALSPVVDALSFAVRWRPLAAGIVVSAITGLIVLAAWSWSDDVMAAWQEVPAAVKSISKSLQKVVQKPAGPITEMKKAAADIESAAQTGKAAAPAQPAAPPPASPSTVSLWDVAWRGWKGAMVFGSQLMVVLFLVFFILASGDLFKRKLLAFAVARDKRRFTHEVIEDIDRQVRRYLAVLLIANILVGLGVWLCFTLMGVKYAGLWGLVAGVLHTAPYFGPALVAAASLMAAFVQFEEWPRALLAAGSTVVVAALVGNIFATWLASRETRMNTTAAFLGLLFFGWLWGFWGILLGIPLLAIAKTVCEHNEDWKQLSDLLDR